MSPDPQMVPLLATYLPPGLDYVSASGAAVQADVIEWRHSVDRLVRSDPEEAVPSVLDSLAAGDRLLLVCPPTAPDEVATLRSQVGNRDDLPRSQGGLAGGGDLGAEADEEVGALQPGDAADGTGRLAGQNPDVSGTSGTPRGTGGLASPGSEDFSLFHGLIRLRCEETAQLVLGHPDLRLEMELLAPPGVNWTPVDGFVLTKLG